MLLKLIKNFVGKFIIIVIGIILLPIFKLIRPLFFIKIGFLMRRMELTLNADIWLRKKSLYLENSREIVIFLAGPVTNEYALKMIRRSLNVYKVNEFILFLCEQFRRFWASSPIWIEINEDVNERDHHATFLWKTITSTEPKLNFTLDEQKNGEELLRTMGIPYNDSFICFHARDKTYMNKIDPKRNWDYHDYRDSDINKCMPAVEYLVGDELWAFRMGAVVEKPINAKNSRIIDYATKYRTEFLDIFLLANCKFFIGNTAGIHTFAAAFNTPCALANMSPLNQFGLNKYDLFIPKKYRWSKSKSYLTFKDVIALGAYNWSSGHKYNEAGIEVIENSEDEILGLASEMNKRLEGTWIPDDEDEELQERFFSLFSDHQNIKANPSRIGSEFLRQNRELLK